MGLFSEGSAVRRRWRATLNTNTNRMRGDIACVIRAREWRLSYRILRLYRQEQRLRDDRLSLATTAPLAGSHGMRGLGISPATTEALKQIIQSEGWPAISRVGRRAARAAWLIVQHSDHDHLFQRRCLDFMRGALVKEDVDPRDMAYLTDRVFTAEGRQQVYGTQVFDVRNQSVLARMTGQNLSEIIQCRERSVCPRLPLQPLPIRDPLSVDDRRRGVGLPPLREYIQQINRCSCMSTRGE